MSYRRSFTKTIYVSYSGSVSYPASQSGGTVHYSGTASEPVTVNIDVDTVAFDSSIENAKAGVGVLTGSVVATEAAQVKSIADNAHKVGTTIVNGFFKTVQSELSQQIAELSANIDATMVHLRNLAARCVDKQRQMAADYKRISSRYAKVFADLNRELENRVYSLDEPAFVFRRQAQELQDATTSPTGASTVAIAGAENGSLHARITASMAKRDAMGAIRQANVFLHKQQGVERLLRRSLLPELAEGLRYAPVVCMELRESAETTRRNLHASPLLGSRAVSTVDRLSSRIGWSGTVPADAADRIRYYYNMEVAACESDGAAPAHSERVRRYLASLFDMEHTEVPKANGKQSQK